MWNAKIQSSFIDDLGNSKTVVLYDNGVTNFTEIYANSSPESIKITVTNKVKKLTIAPNNIMDVGVVELLPDVVDPPPIIDNDQRKKSFQLAYSKLQQLQKVIELGLISEDDPDYAEIRKIATDNFDIDYLIHL